MNNKFNNNPNETLEQMYYRQGRETAIKCNGIDQLQDDGTLEYIFPAEWLKGYRETLLAIQLIREHGIDKSLNMAVN